MSIWLLHSIPANWAGFPVRVMDHEKAVEYYLAEGGALNRIGGAHVAQGGGPDNFTHTFVFCGVEFQAYKVFEVLLDQAAQSPVPAMFVHPLEGPKMVWPRSRRTKIEARSGPAALISVALVEHVVGVKPPPAAAPFVWQVFAPGVITLNLAGYLARLAFMEAWNAAALAAMVAFAAAAMIEKLPELIEGSAEVWAASLESIAVNHVPEMFSASERMADVVRRREERARRDETRYREEQGVPGHIVAKIEAGGAYQAGVWAGDPASTATPEMSPRAHAALAVSGVWNSYMAGRTYDDLAAHIRTRANTSALDPSDADAAAVMLRRWLARANRIVTVTMPYNCAPITTQNARLAESITRIIAAFRASRPPAREFTLRAANTPLSRIALEQLGDANRAQEILDLNMNLIADFNRLPEGTTLRIPAA